MATLMAEQPPLTPGNAWAPDTRSRDDDVFLDADPTRPSYQKHRFSSRFDPDTYELSTTSSPSQVKRAIEAHLKETERRLLDTQKLGESLLKQQDDLTTKLQEVEQHQDEAQIPADLQRRLADIQREHEDVGREVARALIGPKQRQDDVQTADSGVFTSQATGSPTKISAPSTRRARNQPSNRAGDLQFAADISTSLLAQVRQLQAAVAERDETIRKSQSERENIDQDIAFYTQKIKTFDENEQKYKDENWNLETQNHDLLVANKEADDREKKLNTSLAALLAERNKLQNDFDEARSAHDKLSEEHVAVKKAHDAEIHGLKRNADMADGDRLTLQRKVDELISQNEQLARAVSGRSRSRQGKETDAPHTADETAGSIELPEDSPPPSPTKTPARPGLESETLRSSLHHAHKMIQNLKGNIHREKTEKIELKRMLQEARDELEQRRNGDNGSAAKKQRKAAEATKKSLRPDMLGPSRRPRTDIEVDDEDWEEMDPNSLNHAKHLAPGAALRSNDSRLTDLSDAYQTANETEGHFETADERNTTESEAFMTGAESMAGDSTDELTETEDTASRATRSFSARVGRNGVSTRPAGDRTSYLSTASTSADEDDHLQTPIQPSFARFKLRNSRTGSANRQSRVPLEGTPDSLRTPSIAQDSPASTITAGRSPAGPEQSLFAELGGIDEMNSDAQSTPARSSLASRHSTPGLPYTPSKPTVVAQAQPPTPKPAMIDAGTMTEHDTASGLVPPAMVTAAQTAPFTPVDTPDKHLSLVEPVGVRAASPSDFPLPPSASMSPAATMDNSTQYTPHRANPDSPIQNRNFITPPKTVWDEMHDSASPQVNHNLDAAPDRPDPVLGFSRVLSHETLPEIVTAPEVKHPDLAFSGILSNETKPIHETGPDPTLEQNRAMAEVPKTPERSHTVEKVVGAGFLASTAAAFGFSRGAAGTRAEILEDETSEPVDQSRKMVDSGTSPLKDISGNATSRPATATKDEMVDEKPSIVRQDSSSQTLLTSEQIDEALRPKHPATPTVIPPTPGTPGLRTPTSPTRYPARPVSRTRDVPTIAEDPTSLAAATVPVRPSSAGSNRTSSLVSQQHPPLPSDHKDVIARANQIGSPVRRESTNTRAVGAMGPPALPASAMRRPKTPSESIRSVTGNARPSLAGAQRGSSSRISRHSSVSSFASELDERFNIRTDQTSAQGFQAGPGTDPRMIQAITQTMIGEFLWKYTRKAGSKEMSATRHRRYFWVHPYTRTLYWSDQDPQAGSRKEHRSKSVAIESVRVVSDDNPMPPGLHRKSLEITAKGRIVKFTASTGQRHETWFNALSYLLRRGDADEGDGEHLAAGTVITGDEGHGFNTNGYGAKLIPNSSRMSMSSYNSRTSRGTSLNRSSGITRKAVPQGATLAATQSYSNTTAEEANTGTVRQSRVDQPRVSDKDRTIRARSISRISKMMGSMTGRARAEPAEALPADPADLVDDTHNAATPRTDHNSIYDASIVSDHRHESNSHSERGEASNGGLEDVRACCDGKHNVGMLPHRQVSHSGSLSQTTNRLSSAISRSMSRRV